LAVVPDGFAFPLSFSGFYQEVIGDWCLVLCSSLPFSGRYQKVFFGDWFLVLCSSLPFV
jgi:hypothetical protein